MAQKSIISCIQTVAAEMNLPVPQVVVTNQDKNIIKIRTMLIGACDDLLAEHDWNFLQREHAFNTTDGDAAYDFPEDYDRLIDGTLIDTSNRWSIKPLTPVEWQIESNMLSVRPWESVRVFGNQIVLTPTPGPTPVTIKLNYISNHYVLDGNTYEPKEAFTQDSDIVAFDHRVIVYAVKYKWLSSIGQDTTAAWADYTRALAFAKGRDLPGKRLSLLGGSRGGFISEANIPDTGYGS
jgi:hypothetical protein